MAHRDQRGPKLETRSRTGNAVFALFPAVACPLQELLATPSRVEWGLLSRPPPRGGLLEEGGGKAKCVPPFPGRKPFPAAPRARGLFS